MAMGLPGLRCCRLPARGSLPPLGPALARRDNMNCPATDKDNMKDHSDMNCPATYKDNTKE